ncbi:MULTISPECIES: hypothetical protein [Enterococcus]|uniref:hypothetical protein n=1 Tax=Enterococcus TaxID=1350 RepID=UPI00287F6601|nr:hypothetical protein [Enterococcus faecium]
MMENEPLFSIKEEGNRYLFNIYCYQDELVGIEEDPSYLQLFQMSEYGSPTDYFDWRASQTGFGSLLNVSGNALPKDHPNYRSYRQQMHAAGRELKKDLRKWRNRLRK